MRNPLAVLIAPLLLAGPAGAHHLQTPAVVQFTFAGDSMLPRLDPPGTSMALALDAGGTRLIYVARIFGGPETLLQVSQGGDNGSPATALGRAFAWDNVGGSGDPGRQVFVRRKDALLQVAHDPTGTSANPAINGSGSRVAFESTADLTGTGDPGIRRIFLSTGGGSLVQVSQGGGDSSNAAMSKLGGRIVFQSTSDPFTGDDTGIAQIWLAGPEPGSGRRLTSGSGPSRNPSISGEGRFIAFESTAALASGGAETGVPEVFVYDALTARFARITSDSGGCTLPAVRKASGDWRVTFTCSGQGFYHEVLAGQRYRLPIDAGDTARVLPGPSVDFLLVSTTANLLAGGTTPGHQLYLLNLFKRRPEQVLTTVTWFAAGDAPQSF